jgi:hypothetical protein
LLADVHQLADAVYVPLNAHTLHALCRKLHPWTPTDSRQVGGYPPYLQQCRQHDREAACRSRVDVGVVAAPITKGRKPVNTSVAITTAGGIAIDAQF